MDAEVSLGHLGAKLVVRPGQLQLLHERAGLRVHLEAVHLVADQGWKLLPLYRFDPYTGLWHHESGRPRPPLTLHDVSFASGTLEFRGPRATEPESALAGYLDEARRLFAELEASPPRRARCATRR